MMPLTPKRDIFSSREYFDDIGLGDKVDVVYSIEENTYRGNSNLSLVVKDLHKTS